MMHSFRLVHDDDEVPFLLVREHHQGILGIRLLHLFVPLFRFHKKIKTRSHLPQARAITLSFLLAQVNHFFLQKHLFSFLPAARQKRAALARPPKTC